MDRVMATTQNKTVRLNVPVFIEDFIIAFTTEDYKECQSLKDELHYIYNDLNDELQGHFKQYIKNYLKEHNIKNDKELNGLFDEILYN